MDVASRFEFVISESAENIFVSVDKYPEVGREHGGDWLSKVRVLILIGCRSMSASNSST